MRFARSGVADEAAVCALGPHWSLAWVCAKEKKYPAALQYIASAFALDKTWQYRERLAQKLQEVPHHLTIRNQQEYLLLINLVSKHARNEDKKPDEAPPVVAPLLLDGPGGNPGTR